jgi:putative sugar O-methyltransferase
MAAYVAIATLVWPSVAGRAARQLLAGGRGDLMRIPPAQLMQAMAAELEHAPEAHRPSRFWEDHGALHARQLEEHGFERFKRTVNQHYFNWITPLPDDQFRRVLATWLRNLEPASCAPGWSTPPTTWSSPSSGSGRFAARLRYALYVALLWEFPRPHDELGVLEKLEEPSLGEPILVRHRDRAITQDLCNSALELNRIAQATGLRDFEGRTVLEVGAGYGRLVWLIAQRWPGARIVVRDIPPALAIAQCCCPPWRPTSR